MQDICVCGGQPLFQGETGGALFNGNISEKTNLFTYADAVTWTKGKHTFKGGGEVRFASSLFGDDVEGGNFSAFARAFGGDSPLSPTQNIDGAHMPGLQGTSTTGAQLYMRSLLSLLSGSLAQVTELNWLAHATDTQFSNYKTATQRMRQINNREVSVFFKDDWKVSTNVTLNLGMRWDYYGVPWVSNGLTAAPVGGGMNLFGYSGRSFATWMQPGARGDLTQLQFVGPGSPNPGTSVYQKDWHNFGPAVGFAWQIPWFGAGQTTLRGGYQLSFLPFGGGRVSTFNSTFANPPGSSYDATINQGPGLEYLDMTKLSSLVPVPGLPAPMKPILVTDRSVHLIRNGPELDDALRSEPHAEPDTKRWTKTDSGRPLHRNAEPEALRKRQSQCSQFPVQRLERGLRCGARRAENRRCWIRCSNGINLVGGAGTGPVGTTVGGVPQTGAGQLRAATASSLRNNLANGNYVALATSLYTLNYAASNNPGLPVIPTGVQGAVLRYNNFAENFIEASPQFSAANLQTNLGNTNYHSFQMQSHAASDRRRELSGHLYLEQTARQRRRTYTLPFDRRGDYTLQTGDIRHQFRTNGTFAIPAGPGQLLLGKSHGVMARAIEGWQMGWIIDLESGIPASITAQNMLYGNGVPDKVGNFNPRAGKVSWQNGAIAGNYFNGAYTNVADPQCAQIAASLKSVCTLERNCRFFGQHRPAESETRNAWQSRSERHRESRTVGPKHAP